MAGYEAAKAAAFDASEKAKEDGSHGLAAQAHAKAASEAFKSGNPDAGRMHSKLSKKHRARGKSAASESALEAWAKKRG